VGPARPTFLCFAVGTRLSLGVVPTVFFGSNPLAIRVEDAILSSSSDESKIQSGRQIYLNG